MTTDKDYPLSSKLGVLRISSNGNICVSTEALYRKLGWQKYKRWLPWMRHGGANRNGYVTPESCEKFLETL